LADRQKRLEKIRQAKAELERQAREQADVKQAQRKRHKTDQKTAQPQPDDVINATDTESRIMLQRSSSGFIQACSGGRGWAAANHCSRRRHAASE
jgi:hypothetical protein